jgi:hypothetical protein
MTEQTPRDGIMSSETGRSGQSATRWLDDGGISTDTVDPATFDRQPIAGAEAMRPHRGRFFQVYGLGRHRRYYELLDELRPVLTVFVPAASASCREREDRGRCSPHAEETYRVNGFAQDAARKRS